MAKEFETIEAEKIGLLSELYSEAEQRDDNDPLELQEKLTLYGQVHEIMGDLEAFAVGQEKLNYAYRHEVYAQTYMHRRHKFDVNNEKTTEKLTSKEREMTAELAVKGYRRAEAIYLQNGKKWRNRRDSVLEQINIMKRRQDLFSDQWNKANFINGQG